MNQVWRWHFVSRNAEEAREEVTQTDEMQTVETQTADGAKTGNLCPAGAAPLKGVA